MDAPASNRPWEATSTASPASMVQHGQPQLPSISAMTAGVPASGQEQTSAYALSSNTRERDSGNWSMPHSTRKFNIFKSIDVFRFVSVIEQNICFPSLFSGFTCLLFLARSSSPMPLHQVPRLTLTVPMAINICPS